MPKLWAVFSMWSKKKIRRLLSAARIQLQKLIGGYWKPDCLLFDGYE